MKTLTLSLTALFLISCDKACDHNVTNLAAVENQTGSQINLEFCEDGEGAISQQTVEAGTSTLDMGTHKENYVAGGTAKCDRSDTSQGVQLYATSTSFGTLKICHGTDGTTYIVGLAASCPADSVEQTVADDNCRNAGL